MNRLFHNPGNFQLYGMAICLLVVAIANSLSAQQSRRALFNGKDLEGWQQVGPSSFDVKDGIDEDRGWHEHAPVHSRKITHAAIRVFFRLTAKESDTVDLQRGCDCCAIN
jgi:hypothetical protein